MHAVANEAGSRVIVLGRGNWAHVFLALCLCVTVGCPGSTNTAGGAGTSAGAAGGSAAPGAAFSAIYAMIFPRNSNAHCDMCHGLPAFDQSNGNLSTGMDKDSTYNALVGKKSMSSMCANKIIVDPGKPETSLLLQKVMPNPPCGLRMPNGGAPLSDAQIEMIRSWIAAGAKND
jgi:hypothetical protein